MRYGDNVFSTVANTTADDLEFSYGVTGGNNFYMHGGGSNVTSYKKIMALNKGGNVTIGGNITADGNISGSATSTGSFGRVEVNGTELTPSPITALNNATENELVTVGSTTTELDGESNLTFDGSQ